MIMTQYGKITNLLTEESVQIHFNGTAWVDNTGKEWCRHYSELSINYRFEQFGVHKCARIDIGKRIAQLRKQQGMTQAELGDHAGVTAANISRIETGRYSPGLDVLARIANTLGCELAIIEKPST